MTEIEKLRNKYKELYGEEPPGNPRSKWLKAKIAEKSEGSEEETEEDQKPGKQEVSELEKKEVTQSKEGFFIHNGKEYAFVNPDNRRERAVIRTGNVVYIPEKSLKFVRPNTQTADQLGYSFPEGHNYKIKNCTNCG